jgi:hypothetical protein
MTRRPWWGLALLLAAAPGCGDGGPPPSQAGDLTITYFQGGPRAGAILFTISGGPVEQVRAENSELVSFASPGPGTTRVVVTGDLGTGTLLRVRVPDLSQAGNYAVRVDQVADRITFSLMDPGAYTLTIAR